MAISQASDSAASIAIDDLIAVNNVCTVMYIRRIAAKTGGNWLLRLGQPTLIFD